jgi:hypothetical protein
MESKIILTSIFAIRLFDIRLFKSCGLLAPSDDWDGRLIQRIGISKRIAGILPALKSHQVGGVP